MATPFLTWLHLATRSLAGHQRPRERDDEAPTTCLPTVPLTLSMQCTPGDRAVHQHGTCSSLTPVRANPTHNGHAVRSSWPCSSPVTPDGRAATPPLHNGGIMATCLSSDSELGSVAVHFGVFTHSRYVVQFGVFCVLRNFRN